jgi:hypothetical protein
VTAFMDRETRAGMDRGGLIMGLEFAFFAVFLAAGAIALPRPGTGARLVVVPVGFSALFAMADCLVVAVSIIHFNRPKLLVPPQHRAELGAFGSWRRRKGLPVAARTGHRPGGDGRPPVLVPGKWVVARFVANHVRAGRASFEGHIYITS